MTGGSISIRIDESAHGRIIISALEIVEAGFGIVDIATVAERIVHAQSGCHGTGGGQKIAPRVIGILDNRCAAGIQDGDNVTLIHS